MTKEQTPISVYDTKKEILSILFHRGEEIFEPEQIELLRKIIWDSVRPEEVLNMSDEDIEVSRLRAHIFSKKHISHTDFEFLLGNMGLQEYKALHEEI